MRDVIADYGPSLSIIAFTGFTLIPAFSSVSITRINIPSTFGTTSGRPWLVDFNDPGLTSAHKGLAFFPALVLTALYFFDHNVAALLTHRSEFKLKKQLCYDWDLMVLGFMIIICGVLGLPPCNGLIPNSPMHSKALKVYKTMDQLLQEDKKAFEASQKKSAQDLMETKTEEQLGAHVTNRRNSDTPKNCGLTPVTAPDSRLSDQFPEKFQRRISVDDPELLRRRGSNSVEDLELQRRRCSNSFEILESQRRRGSNSSVSERNKPELDHVVDQRLSNLMQSGMVAIMLLILPVVALVPTCVVTGLFLFMGVESLLDGDIYSRIILPFVEKRSRKFLDLGASVTPVWLNNNIKAVNVYTLIQLLAFGLVFYITQTVASIIFPVLILLLIPLRFRLLPRISLFNQKKEGEPDFFEVMDLPLIFDSADASAAAAAAPAEIPLVHIASADDAAANASPSAALGDTVGGGSRAGDASMNAHTASGDVIVSVPPIMLYPNLECIEASQC